MIRRTFLQALISIACLLSISTQSQSQTKTLAERLGYPASAKLLIVHADDLGMIALLSFLMTWVSSRRGVCDQMAYIENHFAPSVNPSLVALQSKVTPHNRTTI